MSRPICRLAFRGFLLACVAAMAGDRAIGVPPLERGAVSLPERMAVEPASAGGPSVPTPQDPVLFIGPVPGVTLGWHPAPSAAAIPLGTTVTFLQWAPPSATVTWTGAYEISRDNAASMAECPLESMGPQTVLAEVRFSSGRPLRNTCSINVMDISAEQIQVSGLTVSTAPVNLDENATNEQTMFYFFGGSIAALRDLGGGNYRTSTYRPVTTAVSVDPPAFASLMEWRVGGQPMSLLGTSFTKAYSDVGSRAIEVGPPQAPAQCHIETYHVVIVGRAPGEIIPQGQSITFNAVTDPPGYEDEITWLSSTKYGTASPVLGYGPTFTTRFDDTWGTSPNGGLEQWLGVRADDTIINQDQKPFLDYLSTCSETGSDDNYQDTTIPAGFFGSGCDEFSGRIRFQGEPLDPSATGDTDTIVARPADPVLPSDPVGAMGAVPIEIVALSLVSSEPITVICDGLPEQWNVSARLSPTAPPAGTMMATKTHANGGTFDSVLPVQPFLTFSSVSDPSQVRTLDTAGVAPPLQFMSTGAPFVHDVDPSLNIVTSPGSNFVVGVEETTPGNQSSQTPRAISEEELLAKHTGCPGTKHPPPLGACCDIFLLTCTQTTAAACDGFWDEGVTCVPDLCMECTECCLP